MAFTSAIDDGANLTTSGSFLEPFLLPRVSGTPANVRVRDHLVQTLSALGWNVETDVFRDKTPVGELEFANVIATWNPHAPRRLVLAAHFDSKLLDGGRVEFIGATDSAAPCAMLVDLATTLAPMLSRTPGATTEVSPELIFFDGEEAFGDWTDDNSLYGSRHLAKRWAEEPWIGALENDPVAKLPGSEGLANIGVVGGATDKTAGSADGPTGRLAGIDAFILLDLLGYRGSRIQRMQTRTAWLWNRLVEIEHRLARHGLLADTEKASVLLESGHPAYFVPGKGSTSHFVDDDHRPFMRRGVPIVHVIPVPFPPVWHTVADDASALHIPTILDITRIMRVLVVEYFGLSS
ncbi:hypothetical protein HK405_003774 [Cladochytrium tenue]|nr:hypothetical protein HK405_003774 [Cladochytrium tenue]